MSTELLEMPAVDVDTDVNLEELWDKDIPCAYAQRSGCTNPATWRGTMISCGHQHDVCTMHKGKMMAALVGAQRWVCSVTKDPITDIEWVEL